jgi:hypothetical protein
MLATKRYFDVIGIERSPPFAVTAFKKKRLSRRCGALL